MADKRKQGRPATAKRGASGSRASERKKRSTSKGQSSAIATKPSKSARTAGQSPAKSQSGAAKTGTAAAEQRSKDRPPTVVIFGAGITGLTAAHELIERGFRVQVVERSRSREEEYGVEVGGLAANQPGVIRADLPRLHPYLFPDEDDGYCKAVEAGEIDDYGTAEFLRKVPIETAESKKVGPKKAGSREKLRDLAWKLRVAPLVRSRPSIDLTETLRFRSSDGARLANGPDAEIERLETYLGIERRTDNAATDHTPPEPIETPAGKILKKEFLDITDERGVNNEKKLDAVAMKIARGIIHRTARIADELTAAERFLGTDLRKDLDAAFTDEGLMEIFMRREVLVVEVRGHANPDLSGTVARDLGLLRAKFVRKILGDRIRDLFKQDPQFYRLREMISRIRDITASAASSSTREIADGISRHLVAISRAAAIPIGRRHDERRQSDRVDFLVVEAPLPGEHGYRYFPAYYRHLFDTMKRTPILDKNGDETTESAYHQLVTPPSVNLRLDRKGRALPLARQKFRSIEELRDATSAMLDDLSLEPRDLNIFMLRIFMFMTASKERRRIWEGQSWMEFLRGNTVLSDEFTRFHQETAIALLSMNADEADAYSYALNAVQLLLDYQGDGKDVDMTLNGPTSQTWLRPWKHYLVRQGVEFFQGELVDLIQVRKTDEVQPLAVWEDKLPTIKETPETDAQRANEASGRTSAANSEPREYHPPQPETPGSRYAGYTPNDTTNPVADFYILALPFEHAGRIARMYETSHPKVLGGDWARLVAFDQHCIPRDADGHDQVQCVPDELWMATKRDDTGKPNHPGYPLRDLSGIQFFFPNNVQIGRGHVIHGNSEWGLTSIAQAGHWRNRLSRREGFLGQLSVDIGNFYRAHEVNFDPKKADVTECLGLFIKTDKDHLKEAKTAWQCPAWEIPLRVWDQILDSDDSAVDPPSYYHIDDGIVFKKRTKGSTDFFPAENRTPFLINLPGQWRLRPGLSVAARGESPAPDSETASDSDISYAVSNQRWVLAGTYMATHTRLMTMEACNESARHAVNAILDKIRHESVPDKYNSQGKQLGRRCEIFDPNQHEIKDLNTLKQLDKALYEENLPHFVEILGIDRMVESMPRGTESDLTRLSKLFDAARTFHKSNGKIGVIPGLGQLPEDHIKNQLLKGLGVLSDIPGVDKLVAFFKGMLE